MPLPDEFWEEPSDKLWGHILDISLKQVPAPGGEEGETVERIVVEVEDIANPDLGFNRTFYFAPSTRRTSKWSIWKGDFKKIGFSVKGNNLIGKYVLFEIHELDFGGGYVARDYPEPKRVFESREEMLAAMAEEGLEVPAEVVSSSSESKPAEVLDAKSTKLLDYLDGKTFEEAIKDIVADPDFAQDGKFMAGLLADKAPIKRLIETGWLVMGDDGKYHKVPPT